MSQPHSGRGKKGVFKRDKIADLLAAAKIVPDKAETKENLTVGELIPRLWPAIGKFIGKRYNYRDIARWMKEQGVEASEETLVTAIGDEVRKRGHGRNGSSNNDKPTEPAVVRTPRTTTAKARRTAVQASEPPPLNGTTPPVSEPVIVAPPKTTSPAQKTSAAFDDNV